MVLGRMRISSKNPAMYPKIDIQKRMVEVMLEFHFAQGKITVLNTVCAFTDSRSGHWQDTR